MIYLFITGHISRTSEEMEMWGEAILSLKVHLTFYSDTLLYQRPLIKPDWEFKQQILFNKFGSFNIATFDELQLRRQMMFLPEHSCFSFSLAWFRFKL